jgi:hypothetical protein
MQEGEMKINEELMKGSSAILILSLLEMKICMDRFHSRLKRGQIAPLKK